MKVIHKNVYNKKLKLEFLVYPLITFVIANLFYFILFNKKDIRNNFKRMSIVISAIILFSAAILFFTNERNLLQNVPNFILFLICAHLGISGYIFILFGINYLMQQIPIIEGYFTYTIIFSVLLIIATLIYIPLLVMFGSFLTLDYRLS